MIQRRIGFEIETGIPITKIATIDASTSPPTVVYTTPHRSEMGQAIKQGTLVISEDASPKKHERSEKEPFDRWKIIEGITDPIDDNLEISAFEGIAKGWISTLTALKNSAQNSPPAQKLYNSSYYIVPVREVPQKVSGMIILIFF